jgi:hypothetical protein
MVFATNNSKLNSTGTVVWEIEEEVDAEQTFKHRTPPNVFLPKILLTLATACESTQLVENMQQQVPTYFGDDNPNGDVSKRLLEYLQQVVGEQSKTVKILKACNQSIIAPAVYRLKSVAAEAFPYKDVRAGWRIYITISEKDVQVAHKKWERSFEDDSFHFKWEFVMVFDKDMKDLQSATLQITEVKFGPKDTPDRQKAFRLHMKNYAAW